VSQNGIHRVSKICVRNVDKHRDFEVNQSETTLVTNFSGSKGIILAFLILNILFQTDILDDPDINCVVEVIGGVTDAREIVMRAIAANKHVVTANKALIAAYLPSIQEALARQPTVRFAYEAAVCGGIPIINILQTVYVGDQISKVLTLLNEMYLNLLVLFCTI
jgi:homoserine dehydrogenase